MEDFLEKMIKLLLNDSNLKKKWRVENWTLLSAINANCFRTFEVVVYLIWKFRDFYSHFLRITSL